MAPKKNLHKKSFFVGVRFSLPQTPTERKFSTWVRPGKRTPSSVKFPLETQEKNNFSGDLVGSLEGVKHLDPKLPNIRPT